MKLLYEAEAVATGEGRNGRSRSSDGVLDLELAIPKEMGANRGFELSVALHVDLPSVEPATAQELVTKAHAVCPYSNATRGNLDVELNVA